MVIVITLFKPSHTTIDIQNKQCVANDSKHRDSIKSGVELTTGSCEICRIPRKVGDPGIYTGFRENSVIPWNLSYPGILAKFPGTMRPHFCVPGHPTKH